MENLIEDSSVQLFEDRRIRTAWDEASEEYYFSVVDVVAVLTDSANPNNYWKVLKKRLTAEGNQSVTNCNQLKLKSPKDGKHYKTDVANMEQLLRIIQSIPSPKAEPLRRTQAPPSSRPKTQRPFTGLKWTGRRTLQSSRRRRGPFESFLEG